MVKHPDCPQCYSGLKGRRAFRGHFGWRAAKKKGRVYDMALRRRSSAEGTPVGEFVVPPGSCGGLLGETLFEFLARQQWPDGEYREPGTLLLLCQDGVWKGWLNDKDGQASCWTSGGTLRDLLGGMDDGLANDALAWRAAGEPKKRKKGENKG